MVKTPTDIYNEIAESYLIDINTEILRMWDTCPGSTVYWYIPEKATHPVIRQIVKNLNEAQWDVEEQQHDDASSKCHCLIISEKVNCF